MLQCEASHDRAFQLPAYGLLQSILHQRRANGLLQSILHQCRAMGCLPERAR